MDLQTCSCNCHTNPHIRHIQACCRTCEGCGSNRKDHAYEEHLATCELYALFLKYKEKFGTGFGFIDFFKTPKS